MFSIIQCATLRCLDKDVTTIHSAGRLEIFLHGVWMTVCGEMFSDQTADVACRQLGFGHAVEHCTNAW